MFQSGLARWWTSRSRCFRLWPGQLRPAAAQPGCKSSPAYFENAERPESSGPLPQRHHNLPPEEGRLKRSSAFKRLAANPCRHRLPMIPFNRQHFSAPIAGRQVISKSEPLQICCALARLWKTKYYKHLILGVNLLNIKRQRKCAFVFRWATRQHLRKAPQLCAHHAVGKIHDHLHGSYRVVCPIVFMTAFDETRTPACCLTNCTRITDAESAD